MNIFYLSANPKEAAQMHCNSHVIKMVLESGQLLSTAHRILDGKEYIGLSKTGRKVRRFDLHPEINDFIYSATHVNHPSAIWCRQTTSQYLWLAYLAKELCIEYTFRYGKTHKCQSIGLIDWLLDNVPINLRIGTLSEPPQAMPDHCKVPGDSVAAYRKYYLTEKTRMLSWAGKVNSRQEPTWYLEHIRGIGVC